MRRLMTTAAAACALAVIAGGALAGCGATPQGSSPPPPGSFACTLPMTKCTAESRRGTALPRMNCGSAATQLLDDRTELLSASPGALTCFDAAARNCRAASISLIAMGVDAGTRYAFVIEPGTDPCRVTEQSQFFMVSGGLRHGPVITTRCQVAATTAQGVTLSCNGRQILIPATARQGGPPG